ncbi:MAG: tRNA (adenosine(37)-N6)-threonylcarbamoyltransferase complex dimerization subunit type 1 TsaB [Candidatus Gastranaerophilales bacterium]|nr:tRNA (adenosine(37)-N6)-threonylcarbamoyltransferase complex dimerization subunit type 1 TsaB [Candidatus Gastranaerophilales bacterium]
MSIRLGIDASQSIASCAISADREIIASAMMERPIENFPTLIRDVVARANISLGEINEIVVCIGPGSQTGIRTAVVTGNALALALHKPVSGVRSTDAAAMLSKADGVYQVAVSAGRRRWYVESYHWNERELCRVDELQLLDEIPADAFSMFTVEPDRLDASYSCACGILMVAGQQRQLIDQSLLSEVLPYERREGTDREVLA